MGVRSALVEFADAMMAHGGHPRVQHAACDELLAFTRKRLGEMT